MNLKILHKLLLGYSFYLGVACIFGLYLYSGIDRIKEKQLMVEIADDSKEELLEIRRNEKNYIIRKDLAYIDEIHVIIKRLRNHLLSFKAHHSTFRYSDVYTDLMDGLRRYSTFVEELKRNFQESAALTTELGAIGRRIEESALPIADRALTRLILEARLEEKNYSLFRNPAHLEALKQRLSRLRRQLAAIPGLEEELKAYQRVAGRLAAHHRQEEELLRRIRGIAARMETAINNLADQERKNIQDYLARSQQVLLWALIILLTVGSALTWFLAKVISSPIRRLEQAVKQITMGDFDLRVDVEGDQETRSLQQAFNAMLDTLALSRESLEHTVHLLQEKSIQLIESEKLASIGILASGVAHEINNPLTNISLTAETILEEPAGLSEEELRELVGDILEQTTRAAAIVDNLLGYSRSLKNTKEGRFDLREALQRAIELVDHELRLHDIKLETSLPAEPALVAGNRGKLEQVFVNIMLNAVQAMGKNGSLSLFLATDPADSQAVVEIRDTGPGIADEHLKKIFDPFFTTKAVGGGTGLGLYVSYGIVREYGGDIEVESALGHGSVFRVRLPLAKTPGKAG